MFLFGLKAESLLKEIISLGCKHSFSHLATCYYPNYVPFTHTIKRSFKLNECLSVWFQVLMSK